jgi:hypothetical protein
MRAGRFAEARDYLQCGVRVIQPRAVEEARVAVAAAVSASRTMGTPWSSTCSAR